MGKDLRDSIAFLLGSAIIVHEAFIHQPPLDRIGLLGVAAALMGFGIGKFNGRHNGKNQ